MLLLTDLNKIIHRDILGNKPMEKVSERMMIASLFKREIEWPPFCWSIFGEIWGNCTVSLSVLDSKRVSGQDIGSITTQLFVSFCTG